MWRKENRGFCIRQRAHDLYGILSYFDRFSVFVWTGENDSNALRVCRVLFRKRKKLSRRLSFGSSRRAGTRGAGTRDETLRTSAWDAMFEAGQALSRHYKLRNKQTTQEVKRARLTFE